MCLGGNRRWVPLTVGLAPAERNRVSLSSLYFNCVHAPEFYPNGQLTGSNHLTLKLKLRSLTPMWMNSAPRLMSRTFLLPNISLVPHFSLQGAHPATTDSAKTPALEPKDLDMIPKKENTAHLSTTGPQQRRLEWNLETLMRFRRRKLRPTHLKVTQQRRPGVEPEDLDVKPKKETTAHPWSTRDSVKRPGSWRDSEEENYSPPIYKRINKEAWFGT